MGCACGQAGGNKITYRILVAKPLGKCPLGRSRRKWENSTKKLGKYSVRIGCG
jgi:hypothetical protein